MPLGADHFFSIAEGYFSFLTSMGYKVRRKTKSTYSSLLYSNNSLVVKIDFDCTEQHLDVFLIQITDGKVPPRYVVVNNKVIANIKDWLPLWQLVQSRDPKYFDKLKHGGKSLNEQDLMSIVDVYAYALREYGFNYLKDNPQKFPIF